MRLLMTLSSLSPLFFLWAVRGTELITDPCFTLVCLTMATFPSLFLLMRICTARKQNDKREIVIGDIEDHRAHVLVYLFAILLPFYREELATYRDLFAMLMALAFIGFLFYRLNLHYLNIWFSLFGFQAFMISPPADDNPYTVREPLILITYRRYVTSNDRVTAYRLSDTVYLERKT